MPSFFHGLNLASRALQTFQRAIDVTGHNISNVNTRGYSRQQVDISTSDPLAYYQNGPRTLGNGAGISSISRTRAGFLDSQMRSAASDMGKNDTVATGLEGILTTYNEPNEGSVSKALGGFFNAWSALASNPNETANRTSVKLAGQKLGSTIRGMYKELKIQSDNSAIAVKDTVAQVNSI
ncbi:MAG: flagellar basal body protein [Armatimonadetes bacterium]|nr:flagellar basal body protein [Armatimonadota bacterium]